MDKIKQLVESLQYYSPFAFSALIIYYALEPASGERFPVIMTFLPLCFFWLGDYLRRQSNESAELREEIVTLKKRLDELTTNF